MISKQISNKIIFLNFISLCLVFVILVFYFYQFHLSKTIKDKEDKLRLNLNHNITSLNKHSKRYMTLAKTLARKGESYFSFSKEYKNKIDLNNKIANEISRELLEFNNVSSLGVYYDSLESGKEISSTIARWVLVESKKI